eukprot:gene53934-25866_t
MIPAARGSFPAFVACQCAAAWCYGVVKVGVSSLIVGAAHRCRNLTVVFSAFSLIFATASTAGPLAAAQG